MANDELFVLGGIWTHWRSPDGGSEYDTFAIITVEPNELVAETSHSNHMPFIVKRSDWQLWLEPGDKARPPLDLLRPFDSELMKAWRVNEKINKIDAKGTELNEPPKTDDDPQRGMFE